MPLRSLRASLSLVVLGLLAEQPLHPYAIRGLMRERGHDRLVNLKPASLYDTVARLTRAGLIEVQGSSRAGRRPERTEYRITPDGIEALQAWLRAALADPRRSDQFSVALSFMYVLRRPEVIELIEARSAALGALIEAAEREVADAARAGVPPIFLSEERYSQSLRLAEHEWLEAFAAQLRSGELRWPSSRPEEASR